MVSPVLTTLHSFSNSPDGAYPYASVAIGGGGMLYGTTESGGASANGTVFSLRPPVSPKGDWIETVHSFPGGSGGAYPYGGVGIPRRGLLFGTTAYGGTSGAGTVFLMRATESPGGAVTETVLHNFGAKPGDGATPFGNLAIGRGGVLYGTTDSGGTAGAGTVFSLTPPTSAGDPWNETVLYSFGGASDGANPYAGVTIGRGGVLYGTTRSGGTSGTGTVYSLTPPASSDGIWTETVLWNFPAGFFSGHPYGGVAIGRDGVLYGTTESGGTANNGTVFSLTPPTSPGGSWTETVLYSFSGFSDGGQPQAGVTIGRGGVLYGTTYFGGTESLCGTVFALAPPASPDGAWTETVLYNFTCGADGGNPQAGVVIGDDGVLYGTTGSGGTGSCTGLFGSGCGTVFSLTP